MNEVEQARLLGMSAKLEAAETRIKELLEDNARGAAYIKHLKERIRELGGEL